MPIIFFEIVGWLGMICILFAYWLVSTKRILPDSKASHLLNLFGAVFVIVNVAYHTAIPSVVLNIIWAIIALTGLFRKR